MKTLFKTLQKGEANMNRKNLKPIKKTECYAILENNGEAYLYDHIPIENFLEQSEVVYLYKKIVKGVFYPVQKTNVNEQMLVGYFIDDVNMECISIYEINGVFTFDMKWMPMSKVIFEAIRAC